MEQEKIILLDNKNGIKYALVEEQNNDIQGVEEKTRKLEKLLKLMIGHTVRETIKQYHGILKEELIQSEEKIEFLIQNYRKEEEKKWKTMDEHFEKVDKIIREKQKEGKRKKHSLF